MHIKVTGWDSTNSIKDDGCIADCQIIIMELNAVFNIISVSAPLYAFFGFLLPILPHILSKQPAAFPHNHLRNNDGEKKKKTKKHPCSNSVHQSSARNCPSRASNKRPLLLKSCTLPTEADS